MRFANFLIKFLFFPLLFGLELSYAEDFDLGDGLKVTPEQLKQIEETLPKTAEDKYFFHWTSKKTGLRWITQGYLDRGEVEFLSRPTGDRQAAGAGIYLAELPTSSEHFGEFPVAFKIKSGTPIYNEAVVGKILGKNISLNQASVLGSKIPFIRRTMNDWHVMNHVQNASELKYASLANDKAKLRIGGGTWDIYDVVKELSEVEKPTQDLLHLKRLIIATDYLDGISFFRAMKVNPESPWKEFEPDNFENYAKRFTEISEEAFKNFNLKSVKNEDMKKSLSRIHSTLLGTKDMGLEASLRNEGVRVGGDFGKGYFSVSESELKNLESNPYLEVIIKEKKGSKYLVEYYYPDAFHFKKLKGKISDELYDLLLKQNPDQLFKNHELRRTLNKKILSELLNELADRSTNVHFKLNINTVEFMRDLISIHPFSDLNGRTIRSYIKLGFTRNESFSPWFMISDNDLLLTPQEQLLYLSKSENSYKEVLKNLIEEYAKAVSEKRTPDYLAKIKWNELLNESIPMWGKIDLENKTHRELIRARRWSNLMSMVTVDGLAELEKNLKITENKEKYLKKILSFNETALMQYDSTIKKQYANIMLGELKETPTKNHAILFHKYEGFFERIDDKSLMQPKEAKDLIIKNIFSEFGSPNANLQLRDEMLGVLKSLERDKLKVLRDYYNLSVKFENIHGVGLVDKFQYDALDFLPLTELKDVSRMDEFLEIMEKICKQNLKLGLFQSIEKFYNMKSIFITLGISQSQLNKINDIDLLLKSEFKNVVLKADQATKQAALVLYAKIAPVQDFFELISDPSIIKGDVLTRDSINILVASIIDSNRLLPNEQSLNITQFKNLTEGLSKWIDAKINSGYIKGLSGVLENYSRFYDHYIKLKQVGIIINPNDLREKILNQAINIFKQDSRLLKLDVIVEIKKLDLSDTDLLRIFDEGFFATAKSHTRSEIMEELFDFVISSYEKNPKLIHLSPKNKIQFLRSLKSLSEKNLPLEYAKAEKLIELYNKIFAQVDDATKIALNSSQISSPHSCSLNGNCKCIIDSLNGLLK